MALGTITKPSASLLPAPDTSIGAKALNIRDVQLTAGANYTTGGEVITPQAVGLGRRIETVVSIGIARATSGGATSRSVAFDYAAIAASPGAVKMQVYTTASAEAAGNSDQSAFSIRLGFIGE